MLLWFKHISSYNFNFQEITLWLIIMSTVQGITFLDTLHSTTTLDISQQLRNLQNLPFSTLNRINTCSHFQRIRFYIKLVIIIQASKFYNFKFQEITLWLIIMSTFQRIAFLDTLQSTNTLDISQQLRKPAKFAIFNFE